MTGRAPRGPRTSLVLGRLLCRQPLGRKDRGVLIAGSLRLACALGANGMGQRKREGDGRTPKGAFRATRLLFRPDRWRRTATALPTRPLRRDDGWGDDVAGRAYNRPVRLPCREGHERLWRDDSLYDAILVLDHNHRPRARGHGSAIFVHIASPGYGPTAGCIALAPRDLRRLLPYLSANTEWVIR